MANGRIRDRAQRKMAELLADVGGGVQEEPAEAVDADCG
jgi:hypothetical protein